MKQDMQSLSEYLSRWRLKLSTAKTTTTAFHLNNRDIHRQLDVVVNGAPLPNNNNPVYLGVTLDRSLTYKKHLESLQSKVNARNGLLRCLAGSSWGTYTSTLRTGALALVYSAAEYASPAWCRSTHTRKLDVALNDTMRIVTGCMRPTETMFLPLLAGITPPDISIGVNRPAFGGTVPHFHQMSRVQIFYSQYDSRYVGCHWLQFAPFLCTNLIGQGPELLTKGQK